MDDMLKNFVRLKYEILTSDNNTWHLCNTYPPEVNSKWAWRCAGDVEHLAKGNKRAEECIRISKLYRDGLATEEELKRAWNGGTNFANAAYASSGSSASSASSAYYAAYAAYYAAYAYYAYSAYAAYAIDAAIAAAYKGEKWNLYIDWLIEELCEYERTHG